MTAAEYKPTHGGYPDALRVEQYLAREDKRGPVMRALGRTTGERV